MKKTLHVVAVYLMFVIAIGVAVFGLSLADRWDSQAKTTQTTMQFKNLRLGEPDALVTGWVDFEDLAKELPTSAATWIHQESGVHIYLEKPDGRLLHVYDGRFEHSGPSGYKLWDFRAQGDNLVIRWYEPMSANRSLALIGIGVIAFFIGLFAFALLEDFADSPDLTPKPISGTT